MHQKSPKEKPCYTLPTVKKLLEQKRKRATASGSPSCSALTSGPPPASAIPVSASQELSPLTGACSGYSDMAVAYGQWDPVCVHQGPTSIQESLYPSVGMGYYDPVGLTDFSQAPAYSTAMAPSYSTQAYPDTMGPQQYLEGPATEAGPSLVTSSPWSSPWFSGPGAQGPFSAPMDLSKLEEARVVLQGIDYSMTPLQDEDGDTILHIYTAKGLREYAFAAAEKLRKLGRLDSKEHKGKTALLVAVTADQPDIVQDLLSLGADINACDVKGQTALHLAATYGYPRVLEVILSNGSRVNLEARNFEGLTPLHCAAISHSGTMKALPSAGLTDASLQALARDKLSCLQMLLNHGASLVSQEIKSNKTVLHLAVKEGNVQLVQYLLTINVANMKDFVNMKAHGHTALHMVAGLHGNAHQEDMLRLLLSRGADPSVRNLENEQPAHLLQNDPRGEQLKQILKKRSASARRRVLSLQDRE